MSETKESVETNTQSDLINFLKTKLRFAESVGDKKKAKKMKELIEEFSEEK